MAEEGIAAANARLIEAFARKDAAAAAACYTEDAKLMAPAAESSIGPAAIRQAIQTSFDDGVAGLRLETVTVESFADTAWEEGRYTLLDEAGQTRDVGKYIVIWKAKRGAWLIHRDIMSTDLPIG